MARKAKQMRKKTVSKQPVVMVQAPAKKRARKSRSTRRTGGNLLKTVGGVVGNLISPGIGGVIGGSLGEVASNALAGIMGHGDYTIKSNSLLNVDTAKDSVPQFDITNRMTRIRHREYITDVISGAANSFSINSYNINPGNALTFPWLSDIASNYEEYKIEGMIFEFKTMSVDALNSTNTALGQVILATQYNVNSAPFVNKQQMENYEFGVSVKPSMSVIHPVECAPAENPFNALFVRVNNQILPINQDLRLYDFGKFSIAVNGMQAANVNVGELWVSYDIVLLKPKLSQTWGSDHWLGTTAPSLSQFFGAVRPANPTAGSNLNTSISDNQIIFPSSFNGYVKIDYVVYGGGYGSVAIPTITTTSGVTAYNIAANGSNIITNGVGVNSSEKLFVTAFYKVVGGGIVAFTPGTGVFPPTPAFMDLFIEAINY